MVLLSERKSFALYNVCKEYIQKVLRPRMSVWVGEIYYKNLRVFYCLRIANTGTYNFVMDIALKFKVMRRFRYGYFRDGCNLNNF